MTELDLNREIMADYAAATAALGKEVEASAENVRRVFAYLNDDTQISGNLMETPRSDIKSVVAVLERVTRQLEKVTQFTGEICAQLGQVDAKNYASFDDASKALNNKIVQYKANK